jgi:hypothetical protein
MRYPSAGTGKRTVADKGWQREFEEPTPLPDRRMLVVEHCGAPP